MVLRHVISVQVLHCLPALCVTLETLKEQTCCNHGGVTSRAESQSQWQGPFFFIQAADTQFGMIETYLEKKADPRWDKEIQLTRQAIAAVNKMNPKPKFFVVCGDLVDAFPGSATL